MKGFTMRAVGVMMLIATMAVIGRADDDDGSPFPTWKAKGNYSAGSAVVRNAKLGGSVGPYFNLTGKNLGDPAIDPTDWYYCCGQVIYPPPPASLRTGSATAVLVPWNTDPNTGASQNLCVPWDKPITMYGPFDGTGLCTSGGLGAEPAGFGWSSFTFTMSPSLPADGSTLTVMVLTTSNGINLSGTNSCTISTAGQSTCTVAQAGLVPINGDAGIVLTYTPGSLNLPVLTLNTVSWSVQ